MTRLPEKKTHPGLAPNQASSCWISVASTNTILLSLPPPAARQYSLAMDCIYKKEQVEEFENILQATIHIPSKKFRHMCYNFIDLVAKFLNLQKVEVLTEMCKGYCTLSDKNKPNIKLEAIFEEPLRVLITHLALQAANRDQKKIRDNAKRQKKFLDQYLHLIEVPFLAYEATRHVYTFLLPKVSITSVDCLEFSESMLKQAKTKEDVFSVLASFCYALCNESSILSMAQQLTPLWSKYPNAFIEFCCFAGALQSWDQESQFLHRSPKLASILLRLKDFHHTKGKKAKRLFMTENELKRFSNEVKDSNLFFYQTILSRIASLFLELPKNKNCRKNVAAILKDSQESFKLHGSRTKDISTLDYKEMKRKWNDVSEDIAVFYPKPKRFRQLMPHTIKGIAYNGSLPPCIPTCLLEDVEDEPAGQTKPKTEVINLVKDDDQRANKEVKGSVINLVKEDDPDPEVAVPRWCVGTDLRNVLRILGNLHKVLDAQPRSKEVCLSAKLATQFLLEDLGSTREGKEILNTPLPRLQPNFLSRLEARISEASGKSNEEALCLSSDDEDVTYEVKDELGVAIPMSRKSHKCLSPHSTDERLWVNSEVIGWWMWRQNKLIENESTRQCRMYFFSPFFVMTLITCSNFDDFKKRTTDLLTMTYEKVEGLTRKKNCQIPGELFDFEEVYFPFNVGNFHWCGAVVSMQFKTIGILDSLGGSFVEYGKLILLYLKSDYEARGLPQTRGPFGDWDIVHIIKRGLQSNSFDCGIYTCMFAEYSRTKIECCRITVAQVADYRQMMYDILVAVRSSRSTKSSSSLQK